jgi:Nif-specific regulatory protein
MITVLSEIGNRLVEAGSLKSGLSQVASSLFEIKDVNRTIIFIYDTVAGKLQPFASEGLTVSEYRRLENLAEKSIFGEIYRRGQVNITEKLKTKPTFLLLNFANNNKNADSILISVPIVLKKKHIGLICVEIDSVENNRFDDFAALLKVISVMISQTVKVERQISIENEKLLEANIHLQQELKEKYDFSNIIGNSGPMRQVYDQVSQVARSNATVLLRGESGTGKEMIANSIHYNSLRAKKPLIKVNCAALPEKLIESELFGFEKGAFTRANQRKKGRFEMADGGTLFLDEIGDLPLQTQIKLLRILQEFEFERLGGTETVKVNVRLIAATNKNLEEEINQGRFREDLFYRLNVFTIFLPPLRERKSDILLLAEHFLEKFERLHNKRIRRISTPAIDMLTMYHFPGNVRELENVIERAVLVCDTNVIHPHHLPPTLQTAEVSGTVTQISLENAVGNYEKGLIQDALKTTHGNCAQAAKLLDTTERILNYKIKKYEIEPRRFRA